MASLITNSVIGGAGCHMATSSVTGLADSRVREAGSGLRGKSNVHTTKFRAATWNIGTLKRKSSEVVETLIRRRVDICVVQEHRWAGGLLFNQTRIIKGKDTT